MPQYCFHYDHAEQYWTCPILGIANFWSAGVFLIAISVTYCSLVLMSYSTLAIWDVFC